MICVGLPSSETEPVHGEVVLNASHVFRDCFNLFARVSSCPVVLSDFQFVPLLIIHEESLNGPIEFNI